MMQARAVGGHAMGAARPLTGAARFAAYAAGQAACVGHVAEHDLGAAAYAIKAIRAAEPHDPDAEARAAILKASAKNTPVTSGVNYDEIAKKLDGYSSADCAALVREAALVAMRRDMNAPKVTKADFDQAMKNVKGSLDPEQVAWLEKFAQQRDLS